MVTLQNRVEVFETGVQRPLLARIQHGPDGIVHVDLNLVALQILLRRKIEPLVVLHGWPSANMSFLTQSNTNTEEDALVAEA